MAIKFEDGEKVDMQGIDDIVFDDFQDTPPAEEPSTSLREDEGGSEEGDQIPQWKGYQTGEEDQGEEGEGQGKEDTSGQEDKGRKPNNEDPAKFTEDEDTSEDEQFFAGVGSILKDKGIFDDTVEIKSDEDIAKAIQAKIDSSIDQRYKAVEEYMNIGADFGVINKIQSAINEVSSVTIDQLKSDPESSKNLLMSEFRDKGYSEESAERYYKAVAESDEYEQELSMALDRRKTSLEALLGAEKQKAQQLKDDALKEEQDRINDLLTKVESKEVFGYKLADSTVEKIKNTLNTVVGHTPEGEPLNALMKFKLDNPVDFEHKLLYLFTMTKGFKDLKAFERKATSKITKEFRSSVSNISSGKSFAQNTNSSKPNTVIDMNQVDDIVD